MPTYVYECAACGHRFEEFQSMTAPLLKKCPACSKTKLQRLIGAGAGVIFKGSGFYQTDYKKPSPTDAGKKEGGTKDKDAAASTQKGGEEKAPKDAAKKAAPDSTGARSDKGKKD